MRILGGTNGLRGTLSRFNDFEDSCPFGCNAKENHTHFLLECKGYEKEREEFRALIEYRCTCVRRLGDETDTKSCKQVFEELDDVGKVMFMLGGPVDGHVPEADIDYTSRKFVEKAYQIRGKELSRQSDELTVADPTVHSSPHYPLSTQPSVSTSSFIPFPIFSRQIRSRNTSRPQVSTAHDVRTRMHARSPRVVGSFTSDNGSGSNGEDFKECD